MSKTSALVVLSGGQDSTTCLLWAKRNYDKVHSLAIDYGQKHRVELAAASTVARIVGVDSHYTVTAANILKGRSPLVNKDEQLETYTDFASMDKTIGDRVELTFVPLRNPFFLLVAANHALAMDCYDIVTGVCAMDNANYPDCTQPFVDSMQYMMNEALGFHRADYYGRLLNIVTPLMQLTKAETVQLAMQYPEGLQALAYSHTCYAGEVPPCGKCHACVLRAEGFRQAGVVDPLVDRFSQTEV